MSKYSREIRERSVCMVLDSAERHECRSAATSAWCVQAALACSVRNAEAVITPDGNPERRHALSRSKYILFMKFAHKA